MSRYATDKNEAAELQGDELLQIVQSGVDRRVNVRRFRAGRVSSYTTSQSASINDDVMVLTSASPLSLTVEPDASINHPIGKVLEVWQGGAGAVTIVAGAGVTLLKRASSSFTLDGLNAGASLRKVSENTWRLIGDLVPA